MKEFVKKTTTVGSSVGVVIPYEVLYAEGIKKFQKVRILIEPMGEDSNAALGFSFSNFQTELCGGVSQCAVG